MAKGHIEIHDPISNHKDLKSSTDASTSDTDNMEEMVEFRILMAYAKRRRVKKGPESPKEESPVILNGHTEANGTSSPQTPAHSETDMAEEKEKKKKKKKAALKRLRNIFSCVKPQTQDEEPPQMTEAPHDPRNRCGGFEDDKAKEEEEEFGDVASQLTEIANEIPFTPPDLETDSPNSPDDNVEKMIGLLLRESGDRLNEKELKDVSIARELFWNYSFFRTLMSALLMRMGLRSSNPDSPGPHASPKTQIAVTCEATSRLTAMDTLPTRRLLGYGARYLNEYYSQWVQEQGGYEAAFESDDEDDVQ
ncbi:apoptosis facilitator Bcl-2-like protein 14 [Trachinotus anak]|uniref:apoptosis facilitator Bcl-2-like protein 14 n=1 Tax=Trachinotus anak TaxID=443729 RepID=UPI0039F2098E